MVGVDTNELVSIDTALLLCFRHPCTVITIVLDEVAAANKSTQWTSLHAIYSFPAGLLVQS